MDVTVVVPVFNRKNRLKDVVDSLLSQDFEGLYEILLIDDGSTDGSCEDFEEISMVRVIRTVNAGAAVARHLGALNAKGSIVIYNDSDDLAKPCKVSVLVKALNDYPNCVVAFGITHEENLDWKQPSWVKSVDDTGRAIFEDPLAHYVKHSYPLAAAMNLALKKDIAIFASADSVFYKASNDFQFQIRASTIGPFVGVKEITTIYNIDDQNRISKQHGKYRQMIFALFSLIENMSNHPKKCRYMDDFESRVGQDATLGILYFLKKGEFTSDLFKLVIVALKYGKISKLPKYMYWARNTLNRDL